MGKYLAILCAALSLSAIPAKASTIYNVDVNTLPTLPGTGGSYVAGVLSPSGTYYGTQSPTYDLTGLGIPIGSTIFFGTLDLINTSYQDQYGDHGYFLANYSINGPQAVFFLVACDSNFGPQCPSFPQVPPPLHVDLFTTYSPYLQFTYTPGLFTPAVPEPSTWAMLLIGFAGIILLGRRRSLSA